jgi:hypothetical protein
VLIADDAAIRTALAEVAAAQQAAAAACAKLAKLVSSKEPAPPPLRVLATDDADEVLTLEEACELAGVSYHTFRKQPRWDLARLPSNRLRRYSRRLLEAMVNGKAVA